MLTAADAATRPNMIFIMADDLGWKDVGYAGADFFETPHIDKMRREGMRFDAAYSGGPNCAPTRGCLMTGSYTPRHHIYQPGGAAKGKPEYMKYLVPVRFVKRSESLKQQAAEQFPIRIGLDPGFTSLAEVLDQGGYKTARLGKWHLGDDVQGFHLSTTDGRGSMKDNFYGNIDVAESLTDRAVKFIEEQRQGPFFLYLSHWDVHTPWKARKQVVAKYRKKLNRIPVDQRRNFNPTYAAMIEAVDTSVGRVLDKVDELGLAENTLIVFTSDNGGIDKVSQLAPLRGEKGSLFEGGVRIPCVMRWTGKIQPDSSCDTPVTSVDYLPTFAGIGGVSLPDDQPVDGVDISPLMTGRDIPERAIFWHYPMYLSGKGLKIEMADGQTYSWRGFPSTSMRRGRFKMIEFHETDRAALYDLEDDPGEQRDLSEARPELARKMRAELDAWQKATQAPVPSMLNPDYIGRAR
jgi:arylsulfatase A-like enzyme